MTLPHLDSLAHQVSGILYKEPDGWYLPLVISEDPGKGNMAAFLDSLPQDTRVVFPVVVNKKLEAMLLKRGFKMAHVWSDAWGEYVDIMERLPSGVRDEESSED